MFRYQLDIFCWLIFLKNFQDFLRKTTAKLTYLKYFKLVKNQEYLKKYQYDKFILLYLLKQYDSFMIKRDPTVMHVYIVILVLFCFFHTTLEVTHPIQPLSSEMAFSPNQSISTS